MSVRYFDFLSSVWHWLTSLISDIFCPLPPVRCSVKNLGRPTEKYKKRVSPVGNTNRLANAVVAFRQGAIGVQITHSRTKKEGELMNNNKGSFIITKRSTLRLRWVLCMRENELHSNTLLRVAREEREIGENGAENITRHQTWKTQHARACMRKD